MASSEQLVSVNVNNINSLVTELKNYADKLDEDINTIFQTIVEMQESWDGESYQEFAKKCNNARPSLDALVLFVRAYAEVLNTPIKTAANKYITSATTALGGND